MSPDEKLPPQASLGEVELRVRDLDRALDFYQGTLGMRVLDRRAGAATVGGDAPLVRLAGDPDAPERPPRAAGLYHVAILLPSRAHLARILEHFAVFRVPLTGAADHLVSEALYLEDPEGNGLEIYADRPRHDWRWDGPSLHMATRVLDVDDLLAAAGGDGWTGVPDGTTVGHVHLQVGDVRAAEAFYRDVVGFDLTARYGEDATFLSAGGYHHHVAANAWGTRGGPPAREGAAGLVAWTIRAGDQAAVDALAARALVEPERGAAVLRDPAGNVVRVVA